MSKFYLSLEAACTSCRDILDWLEPAVDIRALVEEKWFPTHDGLVLVEDDQVIESHTSPSAMVRALVEHGLVDDKFEGKNFSLMYLQGKSPLSSS